MEPSYDTTTKGQPWIRTRFDTTAPAGVFKSVDLISLRDR
jgi:hypothetical protein